jgi:hypothetical protein
VKKDSQVKAEVTKEKPAEHEGNPRRSVAGSNRPEQKGRCHTEGDLERLLPSFLGLTRNRMNKSKGFVILRSQAPPSQVVADGENQTAHEPRRPRPEQSFILEQESAFPNPDDDHYGDETAGEDCCQGARRSEKETKYLKGALKGPFHGPDC